MILNRRNRNQKPIETFLSVDIGTEFLKIALCVHDLDGGIDVVGYTRVKQNQSSMYAAFIVDVEDVTEQIDKAIGEVILQAKELFNENFAMPKQAVMGIAGELVSGISIIVNLDREKPKIKITEKEIEKIIENVKLQTFAKAKEDIAEELAVSPKQLVEIETFLNSAYIDGTRVVDPVGYAGEELSYRVFTTFAPGVHIDSLNQIAERLKLKVNGVIVEPYSIAMSIKALRGSDAGGIIIDVGGGTTDVAIVKSGDVIGTKMFAIGGRVFTKRIQNGLGLDYEASEQKKIDYSDNKLTENERLEVRRLIEKDIGIWAEGLEITLADFQDVGEYPYNVYLCGGGALLPEIQEAIISYPWMKYLNFKKHPKVNFIFPNSVDNVTDKTKSATLPIDVAVLSLARMIK